MNDDSVWEVGSFEISGNKTFNNISFDQSFSKKPYLFLSIQTSNGGHTVTVRAKDVTSSGFKASLFEEDRLSDGHTIEKVSYLAIATDQNTSDCDSLTGSCLILNFQVTVLTLD